jgi:hypothetical protein
MTLLVGDQFSLTGIDYNRAYEIKLGLRSILECTYTGDYSMLEFCVSTVGQENSPSYKIGNSTH